MRLQDQVAERVLVRLDDVRPAHRPDAAGHAGRPSPGALVREQQLVDALQQPVGLHRCRLRRRLGETGDGTARGVHERTNGRQGEEVDDSGLNPTFSATYRLQPSSASLSLVRYARCTMWVGAKPATSAPSHATISIGRPSTSAFRPREPSASSRSAGIDGKQDREQERPSHPLAPVIRIRSSPASASGSVISPGRAPASAARACRSASRPPA